MTSSDLEYLVKYSMTWSIARSLCDSWASCGYQPRLRTCRFHVCIANGCNDTVLTEFCWLEEQTHLPKYSQPLWWSTLGHVFRTLNTVPFKCGSESRKHINTILDKMPNAQCNRRPALSTACNRTEHITVRETSPAPNCPSHVLTSYYSM